jgi:mono/diheme cytochrome c family protein
MFEIQNSKRSHAGRLADKHARFEPSWFEFVSSFEFRASCFAALAALAGCGAPTADFRRYETFAHKVAKSADIRFTAEQRQDIDETLQALFGTPDEPVFPAIEGLEPGQLLAVSRLKLAAGPVGSDEQGNPRGLYREHCAHCHGITGDGAGPTAAFLNPYPRDYRKGQFKFKSTPVGQKPTHDDLKRIILEGIAGTAMPSFKLLPDLEVEALVQYVKYLSIRGEVERRLIMATSELEEKQRLVSTAANPTVQQEQVALIKELVADTAGKWAAAAAAVTEIPPRPNHSPDERVQSTKRGRDLFYGTVANCVKCHGDSALGDGQTTDYDEWAKEFITDGKNRALVSEYVSLGLLPPRNIKPRNLRQGVFRGGLRPIDIYWRVKNGIEGTPMPAATMKPASDPHAKGLTPDDIWDLVNYVESLPYESISDPQRAAELANPREHL